MIDELVGIRMNNHKKIRKLLGTVKYTETKIVLSDPKKHYDEIHALINKEKRKQKKKKPESKKIDIQKMTKEDQIKNLIDLPLDESTLNESTPGKELLFMDEPIEIKSGSNKKEKEEEDKEEDKKEDKEEEKEQEKEQEEQGDKEESVNPIQEGGRLTKKIYVTDLSVDKDKEMFQM